MKFTCKSEPNIFGKLLLSNLLILGLSNISASYAQSPKYPTNDSRWIYDATGSLVDKWDKSKIIVSFPKEFEFGLATAPAHVEDGLNDTWAEFAKRGGVRAYHNHHQPEKRLNFFSDPETEIKLAKETGAKVFRLGVDWSRLVPQLPGSSDCEGKCPLGIQNIESLNKYREIIRLIKKHKMKVMLTLFHHSLPLWSAKGWHNGSTTKRFGWTDPKLVDHFFAFSKNVARELGKDVDYFITFNEASIFALLNHVVGIWPPGDGLDPSALINSRVYRGNFHKALENMATAHRRVYDELKRQFPATPVGIAHHVSYAVAKDGQLSSIALKVNNAYVNYKFPDMIINKLDFLGVNYYGQENVGVIDHSINPQFVYSESGRMINPNGLLIVLRDLYARYNEKMEINLRYYITENGISDDTDLLRPSFIIEHLLATRKALSEGIPVDGYIFWTISDNWEWADGYCPKFGLVHVDRENNLKRTKRPSYYLFKTIVKNRNITQKMRYRAQNLIWELQAKRLQDESLTKNWDGGRPFCRHQNGLKSYDSPLRLPLIFKEDWWFNL